MEIITVLDKNCIPQMAYKNDAGLDLKARKAFLLDPLQTKLIPLGITVNIPKDHVGDIRSRSSISASGLFVHLGTIDPDYKGEVHAIVTNMTLTPKRIEKYQRIAQLIVLPIYGTWRNVFSTHKARDNKGFGSSDKV